MKNATFLCVHCWWNSVNLLWVELDPSMWVALHPISVGEIVPLPVGVLWVELGSWWVECPFSEGLNRALFLVPHWLPPPKGWC